MQLGPVETLTESGTVNDLAKDSRLTSIKSRS